MRHKERHDTPNSETKAMHTCALPSIVSRFGLHPGCTFLCVIAHSPFHASNKAKLALLGKAFFVEACGAIDSLASDRTSAERSQLCMCRASEFVFLEKKMRASLYAFELSLSPSACYCPYVCVRVNWRLLFVANWPNFSPSPLRTSTGLRNTPRSTSRDKPNMHSMAPAPKKANKRKKRKAPAPHACQVFFLS